MSDLNSTVRMKLTKELNQCTAIVGDYLRECDNLARYDVSGSGACPAHLTNVVKWRLQVRDEVTVKKWTTVWPTPEEVAEEEAAGG